jgi:hypothetical protein
MYFLIWMDQSIVKQSRLATQPAAAKACKANGALLSDTMGDKSRDTEIPKFSNRAPANL